MPTAASLSINVPSSLIRILPWAMDDWRCYENLNETGRANEYYAKAFQLREHASEREKLEITTDYYQKL